MHAFFYSTHAIIHKHKHKHTTRSSPSPSPPPSPLHKYNHSLLSFLILRIHQQHHATAKETRDTCTYSAFKSGTYFSSSPSLLFSHSAYPILPYPSLSYPPYPTQPLPCLNVTLGIIHPYVARQPGSYALQEMGPLLVKYAVQHIRQLLNDLMDGQLTYLR